MDNSTHNMSEQLVLYLDGELTGAERTGIENLLSSDAAVQAEYESLLRARAAVKHYGLKQQIAGIHKEMMGEMQPPVRKINSRKVLRYTMAAAASLVLLIGGYLAYSFFTLSPGKIFSSHYETYELSITRNSANELTPAEKAYSEKKYSEVLRIHDTGEDKTAKGEFLCGAAALEVKDNGKAIKCFNEVLDINSQSGGAVFNDESEYYLALAYINNEEYDFALQLLQKIKGDKEHKYYSSVSPRLIRQVKMLRWK